VEESKKLNTLQEPCMIISASGMCEAGRILHHLANNIADSKNTVLIVGFMAENTLGRRLVDRIHEVKIYGEEIPLKAEVVVMDGFSAHADRDELLSYYDGLNKERLRHVFVVHGEPDQSNALAEAIREKGMSKVTVPQQGDSIAV
jgi:metallo-beta-lactamase family protein